jgi:hypothetical protein
LPESGAVRGNVRDHACCELAELGAHAACLVANGTPVAHLCEPFWDGRSRQHLAARVTSKSPPAR